MTIVPVWWPLGSNVTLYGFSSLFSIRVTAWPYVRLAVDDLCGISVWLAR